MIKKESLLFNDISWHLLGITVFVVFESEYLHILGQNRNLRSAAIFYVLDILFFLFSSIVYFPILWNKVSNKFNRLFFVVLIIAFYGLLYNFLGILNQITMQGKILFPASIDSFIVASWRGFYITIITTAVSLGRFNIEKTKKLKEQEILIIQSERQEAITQNNFLRSQINPHFLYNNLSLVYSDLVPLSQKLADTVEQLVKMMEYALHYNIEHGKVNLEVEIAQMERYVNLQQNLKDNLLMVSLVKKINSHGSNLYLPPLLFINFIENVFKYGDLKDPEDPATIIFSYDGKQLKFKTYNKIRTQRNTIGKQIGIENARSRILQYYGSDCTILISKNDTHFLAEVTINI